MPYTRKGRTTLSFNYTFWLNIVFGLLAACCVWLNRKHRMDLGHHQGPDHADDHPAYYHAHGWL